MDDWKFPGWMLKTKKKKKVYYCDNLEVLRNPNGFCLESLRVIKKPMMEIYRIVGEDGYWWVIDRSDVEEYRYKARVVHYLPFMFAVAYFLGKNNVWPETKEDN